MIQQVFTVFDSAAGLFLEPFFCRTVEEALRKFRATVNHPDAGNISKFPEDYTLFHIGQYEQETGLLDPFPTPHSLGVAVTFIDRAGPSLEAASNA